MVDTGPTSRVWIWIRMLDGRIYETTWIGGVERLSEDIDNMHRNKRHLLTIAPGHRINIEYITHISEDRIE